jgi:hypothetical protein
MKLDKYLTTESSGYNDPSSMGKYKFTGNTKISLDNDVKISINQIKSIKAFVDENFRKAPKDVIDFLTVIVNKFDYVLGINEGFKDLRPNSEFPKDDGTQN